MSRTVRDRFLGLGLPLSGVLAGGVFLLIVGFLVGESIPALTAISPFRFITDADWRPTEGEYGLGAMAAASILVVLGALLLAAPIGIGVAAARVLLGPGPWRRILGVAVALLAGVPSVVLGLWGLEVVVPRIATVRPPGASLLAGIIVLAAMTMPTIALMADAAIRKSHERHRRAAAALALSPLATLRRIILPDARRGLFVAVTLGATRAIGETMVVLMVCGNVPRFPGSIFDPVRTLTANIALEMAYALDLHRGALFLGGLLLVAGVLAARALPTAIAALGSRPRRSPPAPITIDPGAPPGSLPDAPGRGALWRDRVGRGLLMACGGLAVGLLASVVGFVSARAGWPGLSFLIEAPSDQGRSGGIGPILLSTVAVLTVCLAVAVPIGIGAALLLHDRGRGRGARLVRLALDVLAGIPSVVFGLFGLVFFGEWLGGGVSILTGGLTLACMILPLLVRTIEVGLAALPPELSRAGWSLGLSREAVLTRVLLPAARPALAAGLVLSIGRALAETAAVLYTSGFITKAPGSFLDSGRVLSVHIYEMAMRVPGGTPAAARSALVLLLLVLFMHGLTLWLLRPKRGRGVVVPV